LKDNIPKVYIGTAKEEGSMFADPSGFNSDQYPPKSISKKEAQAQISDLSSAYNLKPSGDSEVYARLGGQGVIDFLTDGMFVCGVLEFADKLAAAGAPVYVYEFKFFPAKNPMVKTPH